MKNRRLTLALAIAATLATPWAHALGLGPIIVRSGLNEPLRAEIPILEATADDLQSLETRLASSADFARVGLSASVITVPLIFAVIDGRDGKPAIAVTTVDPVGDPMLSILIEVNWASGRLLREYNVLLDPPRMASALTAPAPAASRAPQAVATAPAAPEPRRVAAEPIATAPAPRPRPAAPSAAVVRAPAPPAVPTPAPPPAPTPTPTPPPATFPPTPPPPTPAPSATAGGIIGPVQAGDTLWELALANRPSPQISIDQMMIAMQRENPRAFIGGNINRLRTGATLTMPDDAALRGLTRSAARTEVLAQSAALVAASSAPPPAVAAAAPAPSARAPAAEGSRLEVLPPRSAEAGGGSAGERAGVAGGTDTGRVAALNADLKRTQETLASREQESGELRARVSELEKLEQDRRSLVDLKDSELASLRAQLVARDAEIERLREQSAQPPAAIVGATEPAPAAVADSLPDLTKADAENADQTAAIPNVEDAADVTAVPDPASAASETLPAAPAAITPLAVVEAPPVVTPPIATSAAEPAPVSPAAEAWWQRPIWLGALVLGLLGLALAFALRRKREPAVGAAAYGKVSVADSFDRNAGDEHAVGDVASDDTERRLLEYLATSPNDLDAHLDLVRVYHARSDLELFETAANAMYAQVYDPQAPQWQSALELGRDLLPDHPLFAEPGFLDRPAAAASDASWITERNAPGDPWQAESQPPTTTTTSWDSATQRFSEVDQLAPADDTSASGAATADADPARDEQSEPNRVTDIDFERPLLDPVDSARAGDISLDEFADTDMELDNVSVSDDVIGTKLDLARAYMEMGDSDGARSMLLEVLAEASGAPRDEAQRLLDDLND